MSIFDKDIESNSPPYLDRGADDYVLIVDDDPMNIRVLGNTLKEEFQVRFAKSGIEALEMIRLSVPPELILLDIMMPEMDGYNVCEALKKDVRTKHIPVIFVTARDKPEDQYRGFLLGAVDYVTKPFNQEIVAARVRAHVALKRYRDQLENHISSINMKLLDRQRELDQQRDETHMMENLLTHAQKMSALGAMVSEISHEIKNLVNYVMLSANSLEGMWEKVIPLIEQRVDDDEADLYFNQPVERFKRKFAKSFDAINEGVHRIKTIVEELKEYYRKQGEIQTHEYIDVNKVIESALTFLAPAIRESTGNFQVVYEETPYVKCAYQELEQVIVNLVQNACHALEGPQQSIQVRTVRQKNDDTVGILIKDEGVGIPDENMSKIFDPYFTTKTDTGGTGIGIMLSNRLVKKNKGKLSFSSEEGKGTIATISLPAFINKGSG